jgi:hypothetical protein
VLELLNVYGGLPLWSLSTHAHKYGHKNCEYCEGAKATEAISKLRILLPMKLGYCFANARNIPPFSRD